MHDAAPDSPETSNETGRDALLHRLVTTLGLRGTWERPQRGSAVVAVSEHEVLKLMAPQDAAHAAIEVACLATLDGQLPVRTPQLLDHGEFDGWHYLRMSRLPGVELVELWPSLDPSDQRALAAQLGELLRVLHALAPPAELPRLDWDAWRSTRLTQLEATQRSKGCPEALIDGLVEFVAAAPPEAERCGWLHTEIMREHLLAERTTQGWRLSGLFDFEPSWVAPVDYEFASVGLFVSAGEPALLAEVLRAANVTASPQRLFAMAMLHRYTNLRWYHERLGGPLDVRALAERWFGTEVRAAS